MSSSSLRSLVALNILSFVLAVIILIAGKVASNIGRPNIGPSASDFEQALATKIGKPYTEKMHTSVSEWLHDDEEIAEGYWEVLNSHGRVGFQIGIFASICSLSSLVIAVRSNRKSMKSTEGVVGGNG